MNRKILLCLALVLGSIALYVMTVHQHLERGVSNPRPGQHQDVSQSQVRRFPYLIAHIEHDSLSFSVSLDDRDMRSLKIHISEEESIADSSPYPTVQLRVQLTDDKIVEGEAPKPLASYGNGGWAEMEYRFELGRRVMMDDIHSVTISINGQRYMLCPF